MTLADIVCNECVVQMEPIWFIQKETNAHGLPTGRVRQAVDYLVCPCCLSVECVDDSFDGPWYKPNN